MSSLSRRACYKCGNVGHYAGMIPMRRIPIHEIDEESQRCARLRRGFATTASSQGMSQTAALIRAQQRQSSAITARVSATCRRTARR